MKCTSIILLGLMLLAVAGCKPKAKEISSLERKQAASLVSEAQFAVMMRDYARAEPLFAEAAKLCPDNGEYWLGLGVTRKRLGNTAGAKTAYEEARAAYRDAYKSDPERSDMFLQELYSLALLGKIDEARSLLAKAEKKSPDDPRIRAFVGGKELDELINEPDFKQVAL